jgi:uracil-DNA glycosylase family 4
MSGAAEEPPRDCPLCPRLAAYRAENRAKWPDWHNAPVPCWGPVDARIMVLGMAPGVRGANRTGRPFTGDHAGRLLYATLRKYGLAEGEYLEDPNDGLRLTGVRIVNAVRCVPPANLPEAGEVVTCNRFLRAEIAAMPRLRGMLVLGVVAHQAALRAFGLRLNAARFAHGAQHELPGGVVLADSYHVSRYNTQTRRLTTEMFEQAVEALLRHVERL